MTTTYDALALFSGGLDSILAARTVMAQGLRVKCLHFTSPFFGKPRLADHWREVHGLDVAVVDISEAFVAMMAAGPANGYGKFLNPCLDCKILMLGRARALLPCFGASFIISGEVMGQRPMSQRRDAMDIVSRDAHVRDVLLRPLCARRLEPTPMERSGLVDRERLHGLFGRGRQGQMALAREFALAEIPTPAGGCRLAEAESVRRYWPVLRLWLAAGQRPPVQDFVLADTGRQYWAGRRWLSIGRDSRDNETLAGLARDTDLVFEVRDFPGPLAVGRQIADFPGPWDAPAVRDAAALTASFSSKAMRPGAAVTVSVTQGETRQAVSVAPCRDSALGFAAPVWSATTRDKADLLKIPS